MSLVRTIVTDTLRDRSLSAYATQAEPVIVALERAESALVDNIRQAGNHLGASATQVERFLTEVGLVEPTPAPAMAPPVAVAFESDSVEERLARLEALAERHLGSGRRF